VDVGFFCGGACLLRTEAARVMGGFPVPFFLYYEDTDLSWRLGLAGHRIRYAPDAVVHHLHSASSDQSSVLFAFHNQRNQLLTVLRNAPLSLAAGAVGRFVAITVLRVLRPGSEHTQRPGHRWRVLASVIRMTPGTLAARRRIGRQATLSRRAFRRRWVGAGP
jgi:GT2 family glycosyltransferase